MKRPDSRTLIVAAAFLVLLSTLIFNTSLRNTISRQRAIRHTAQEYQQVSAEAELTQAKIKHLEQDPAAYEGLVRSELGYLRPGEKEVRIVNDK